MIHQDLQYYNHFQFKVIYNLKSYYANLKREISNQSTDAQNTLKSLKRINELNNGLQIEEKSKVYIKAFVETLESLNNYSRLVEENQKMVTNALHKELALQREVLLSFSALKADFNRFIDKFNETKKQAESFVEAVYFIFDHLNNRPSVKTEKFTFKNHLFQPLLKALTFNVQLTQ